MGGKDRIINLFRENVLGRRANTTGYNAGHDGSGGHWLERQMGVVPNSSNTADLLGYEMKNDTTSKTTFGDWSPDIAIYKRNRSFSRGHFLEVFGKPNEEKGGRFSWSGEPAPKISGFNAFGQKLIVDTELNIHAIYSYSRDQRVAKSTIVPVSMQTDLTLATWIEGSLRIKLESKFNQNGWFKCLRKADGTYYEIVFGDPINYTNWIALVKRGVVFFDSGMYQGNPRPYAQWRANNSLWDSLITSRYS